MPLFREPFHKAGVRHGQAEVLHAPVPCRDQILAVLVQGIARPRAELRPQCRQDFARRQACHRGQRIHDKLPGLALSSGGDMPTLVENYLPKPAIDRITIRQTELLRNRGWELSPHKGEGDEA